MDPFSDRGKSGMPISKQPSSSSLSMMDTKPPGSPVRRNSQSDSESSYAANNGIVISNRSYSQAYGYVDYLEDLVASWKRTERATDNSKFWKQIQLYVLERQKELPDEEPTFYKQQWRVHKAELLFLQEELQECEYSESKDETKLLEAVQRISAQRDADKKLKLILDRVYRGELPVNKVYSHQTLLREYEHEKMLLQNEYEKLKLELKQQTEKLEQQIQLVDQLKKEAKNLKEQFGGVIIREIAHKEKELREDFKEREEEIRAEFAKALTVELDKKGEDQNSLQEEIDRLKHKNVEWVMREAEMANKLDKLGRENTKLERCYRNAQQEYVKVQNNHTQIEYEYTQLKKEYNELFIKYKTVTANMHAVSDNVVSPEEIGAKFQKFASNRRQEQQSANNAKYKTVAAVPKMGGAGGGSMGESGGHHVRFMNES